MFVNYLYKKCMHNFVVNFEAEFATKKQQLTIQKLKKKWVTENIVHLKARKCDLLK